jgi:large subunit ribosomal protein L18
MTNPKKGKAAVRRRKAMSTRNKLRRYSRRPRLSVFRSSSNIYCQIIDDARGCTLASASSVDKSLREQLKGLKKTDVAAKIGTEIAGRAKAAGVVKVAFDRGSYKFHGRVKALADAARAAGLEF